MNIGTSLKTISKNQLCSFIGTGGYVELAETDVLSDGSLVTAAAMLPLLNSRNDKGEGILPPGYQRMEYLESSGTQWLLLPGYYSQNSGFLADIKYNMPKATPYRQFWAGAGVISSSSATTGVDVFAPWHYGYLGVAERWWRIRGEATGAGQIWNKECHVDFNWLNTKILKLTTDEGTITQDVSTVSFNYTRDTIAIFAMIDGDTNEVSTRTVPLHIKYLKISDGENVVRDLIPCLDGNGTPCMFDTVKKQPFYNKGTGEFRVGIATLQQVRELQLPDNTGNAVRTLYVSLPQEARTDFTAQNHLSDLTELNWSINAQYRDGDIPADYTKVDFLESSGMQKIDINYQPTENTGYYTDFENTSTQLYQHVLSASADGAALVFTPHYNGGDYNFFAAVAYRDGTQRWNIADLELLSRKKVKFNYLNTHTCVINNQHKFDIPTDPLKEYQEATTCLFMYPTSVHQNEGLVGRLYAAEITEDESIAMDLIPVLNDTGTPGMYDKVGKQFYENSGTGAFIVGIKTLNDARMLNNALPDVTAESPDSITLSLPVEASTDAPAQKALKELSDRGWNIIVQYREDEIPAGYAKVSFLESSGTQYIDTEVITDGTYTIQGRMSTIQKSCAYWGRITTDGGAPSETFPDGNSTLTSYDATRVCVNYIRRVTNRDDIDIKQVHTYEMKEGQLWLSIDDLVQTLRHWNEWTVKSINNNQLSYYLFWQHKLQGVSGFNKAIAAIYSFRMQDGSGNTVLDFIPVINTDGVPGMWDTVSQQFFENAGTGQFRVGLASKEAVRNLYLEPNVPAGTTINLSVPAGTTTEDTDTLKANNPNYTFNIQYRS